jgi:hypothetical protein
MTHDSHASRDRDAAYRKDQKLSSAASNVVQARKRMAREDAPASLSQNRIERGISPTGKPTLKAIFPRQGGREPQHLNLSFLLTFPNLQQMFAEAFLSWGASFAPKTRIENAASLKRYFFAYLTSAWSTELRPEDINDEVLIGFKDRLLNQLGAHFKPLHPTTVSAALSDLRTVLTSLNTGAWASAANRIAELIPAGPVGADRKATPTQVLGMTHLLSIMEAAESEVLAVERRLAEAAQLLAEGRMRLNAQARITNNNRSDYSDFATCLAALAEAYPNIIPGMNVLKENYPSIANAVRNLHRLEKVESYLYPSSRDLVPFVLLLAVATVFNPETLLDLTWENINCEKDRAGTPAIEIIGAKGRADRNLVRLIDANSAASSKLSLQQLLRCLENITLPIRALLAEKDSKHVFVYVPRNGEKRPKAFGTEDQGQVVLRSSDPVWGAALRNFIKDNKIAAFTLSQLRPSILDLVQFMDGSLESARKVGNHRSASTTWTHYTSGGVRSRYRERIGQIILLRERWVRTRGAIDPRRLEPQQDKGAATPGFSCLNPLDSPRPNQRSGKLCSDYGGCPSCAMAAAHPSDPICVAHYVALEMAIYRSQATMSPQTWVSRWVPVLADLTALRSWIPPDVFEASKEISIRLPNVG